MASGIQNIDIGRFYPGYMNIEGANECGGGIKVAMRIASETAVCPICGTESGRVHSRRWRRGVTDLPILGHEVCLDIQTRRFFCDNKDCTALAFAEDIADFVDNRWRRTRRCEEFIIALAMNTSCESAARICGLINISVSGDTVIRMLLRNVKHVQYEGDAIGVDDWAIRKGQNYGTMICDLETRKPIALLPGRDGEALKKWLAQNKQVKVVSRDRASDYAAAVRTVLPDAIQVADRFHLHKNLLDAVYNSLKSLLPERVWLQDSEGDLETVSEKKERDLWTKS